VWRYRLDVTRTGFVTERWRLVVTAALRPTGWTHELGEERKLDQLATLAEAVVER